MLAMQSNTVDRLFTFTFSKRFYSKRHKSEETMRRLCLSNAFNVFYIVEFVCFLHYY